MTEECDYEVAAEEHRLGTPGGRGYSVDGHIPAEPAASFSRMRAGIARAHRR
jgi:hypothetical protein